MIAQIINAVCTLGGGLLAIALGYDNGWAVCAGLAGGALVGISINIWRLMR